MPYYRELRSFLANEYATRTVYPSMYDIFNAFRLCPYEKVKVVILGQDPYHGPGQAHGLAFSVRPGVEIPPSLKNIFKEMQDEIGFKPPSNGFLEKWAKEGVFLLNSTLTVRRGEPLSHRGKGWEIFTDRVISKLSDREDPMAFLLWGGNARSKKKLINADRHLVLEAPHPSPLSAYAGFFGCGHFKRVNEFLKERGETLDWSLE